MAARAPRAPRGMGRRDHRGRGRGACRRSRTTSKACATPWSTARPGSSRPTTTRSSTPGWSWRPTTRAARRWPRPAWRARGPVHVGRDRRPIRGRGARRRSARAARGMNAARSMADRYVELWKLFRAERENPGPFYRRLAADAVAGFDAPVRIARRQGPRRRRLRARLLHRGVPGRGRGGAADRRVRRGAAPRG